MRSASLTETLGFSCITHGRSSSVAESVSSRGVGVDERFAHTLSLEIKGSGCASGCQGVALLAEQLGRAGFDVCLPGQLVDDDEVGTEVPRHLRVGDMIV